MPAWVDRLNERTLKDRYKRFLRIEKGECVLKAYLWQQMVYKVKQPKLSMTSQDTN